MKIKLSAVIPTTQYGNIQPEFEMNINKKEYSKTILELEGRIQELWAKYGERPLTINNGNFKRLKDFFGNEIDYNPVKHEYWWEGVRYISGSEFAESFEKPFNKDGMSAAVAKRDKRDQQEIIAEWELNGEVSRGIGTALHGALELFGKYGKLTNNIMLKTPVNLFYDAHKEKADYEVLVVDHKTKRAGRIDRLCDGYIEDYKTDSDISKKIPKYTKQLNFYRSICEGNGLSIKGMKIYHWNGLEWITYEVPEEDV